MTALLWSVLGGVVAWLASVEMKVAFLVPFAAFVAGIALPWWIRLALGA